MRRWLTDRLKMVASKTPVAPSNRFRRTLVPSPHPRLIRIGSSYGGWVIPDDVADPQWICYSGGVGLDVSFDLGLIERYGCNVHAFDPTPSSVAFAGDVAARERRFLFHPWGVWSEDGELRFFAPDYSDTNFSILNLRDGDQQFDATCRSLQSIMHELGHDRIDLLKLDIEGAEYDVLNSMIDGDVEPTVLCVEFHKAPGIRRMVTTSRRLRERGYRAVHVDGYDVTFVRD